MSVIVKLYGGLGNQLFQYATGRRLAIDQGSELTVDLCWYKNIPAGSTPRQEMLSYLNSHPTFIDTQDDPVSYMKTLNLSLLDRLYPKQTILREKTPFTFEARILKPRQHVYIDGYWQSFRYFSAIRSTLIDEIKPGAGLGKHYTNLMQTIEKSTNPVAMHIRRGDYVTSMSASTVHGALPVSYYRKAMDTLNSRVGDVDYFIFSDDPDWVHKTFGHQSNLVIVDGATKQQDVVNELFLMSQCRHFIIANSSLSWWAAWLGNAADKTVITPKQWLNSHPKMDLKDLIPHQWIGLDQGAP